ncbi:hypothetical protein [Flavivirga eckloniae]|uniref:Uncharacterized protein n=1 Tax=Flavivirga eckloniae TaxID=1803846 RepID=A0A2K9PT13_9FLAO|nr:hypothetical protein [Flavivirga eckloniae]AUP80212.1 hypothetical protein C1H87_16435 [Flavivirga eckloniae]
MKSKDILFRLSPDYKNQFVDIQKTTVNLGLEFQNGKHTITTKAVSIGRLEYINSMSLYAELSFTYEFDAKHKVLTICGTDYEAKESMTLTTFPEGTAEYCHQGYSKCTIEDEGSMCNPNWNYNTQMTPNLESLFVDVIKEANNTLIETLQNIEGLTVQIKTSPPQLSPEAYLETLLVYKKGEFVGIYDPKEDYGDDYSFKSIESVWGGEVTFNYGENFANVIGSSHDPHIGGKSWIGLWQAQYGLATTCTSLNYKGFHCNVSSGLVGGHVILGTVALKEPAGSDSVYIMPICTAHNNNDNVYMAALQYVKGIWLKNYLNKQTVMGENNNAKEESLDYAKH